jgi:hypothetical protein
MVYFPFYEYPASNIEHRVLSYNMRFGFFEGIYLLRILHMNPYLDTFIGQPYHLAQIRFFWSRYNGQEKKNLGKAFVG